jgi:thiamine biosynthesis lipoprotein
MRIALLCGTVLALAAEAQALERFEAVEPHMGTLARIVLYAPDAAQAKAGFAAAFARIKALEAALSDYLPTSELNRLCRSKPGVPVKLSRDLFRVLDQAQRVARTTHGAFDVTVGPLTKAWRAKREPTDAEREAVGYTKLKVEVRTQSATLLAPGMQLDLGGIAKGYAAEEAIHRLEAMGLTHAMVSLSGDIAAGEAPPFRDGWRVELGPDGRRIELLHQSVSTSGDTEQFWERDGIRFSHIFDPEHKSALPAGQMVSVIGMRGMLADALSTALRVIVSEGGVEKARHVLDDFPGYTAVFSTNP